MKTKKSFVPNGTNAQTGKGHLDPPCPSEKCSKK